MGFASPFLGARPFSPARPQPRASMCATSAPASTRGCGWVRRAALNAGRAVKARTGAQCIEWSVPENEVAPSCRLEALAWAADAAVENGRETMPFATLQGRARKMPGANGAAVAAALRGGGGAGVRVLDCREGPLVAAVSSDIPGLTGDGGDASVGYLAREVVALPYQVLSVRVRGADAFVLQAAMWPVADIGYQCKLAKVLGMACVVEAHTAAQVEALLEARPGVAAVLLCARDADGLQGDPASFEELYAPCRRGFEEWGVPVIAEGTAEGDPEAEAALCPSADALLVGLPPL